MAFSESADWENQSFPRPRAPASVNRLRSMRLASSMPPLAACGRAAVQPA
jgi:hypothetical protein